MSRSCGIRIGPRRFELVVLDGSPKKHRIVAHQTGELPLGADGSTAEAVSSLKAAVKASKAPSDSVSIAIDTGLAAFRTVKMPDLDESKIEAVLKFEVESELPQWNIDDVVIDFQKVDSVSGETTLLVSAVPKDDIARQIDICARAGVEPQEVELEVSAMVNAALGAGIGKVDDAQVLVHVGESSTAVVVVDGGRVRSMRAIHIGALSHEPVAGEVPEPVEGEEAEPAQDPQESEDAQRKREEQIASRIRRELGRTLSGARTAQPIEAVHVCGWPLPGLVGTTLQDIPLLDLDVFGEDSGQPPEGAGALVVAYGAALRMLGGGQVQARLRREELRYSGTLERVELPLAIGALLLVTLLAVFNIFELKQVMLRDADVDLWRVSTNNFMIGDMRASPPVPGNLDPVPEKISRYFDEIRAANELNERGDNPEIDENRTRLEQMIYVRGVLREEVSKLNRELGNTGEITQPQSALEGATMVLLTLGELGDANGRAALRQVEAQYRAPRAGGSDSVEVTLDMTFFADDTVTATRNSERFVTLLREKPWCMRVDTPGSKEFSEDGAVGITIDRFTVLCDLSQLPDEGDGA